MDVKTIMTNIIMQIYLGFFALNFWITCGAYGQNSVVRSQDGSHVILHKTILENISPVTTGLECRQLCAANSNCKGSMLYSTTCVLYRKSHCPCTVWPSISAELTSRYMVRKAEVGMTFVEMDIVCQRRGMHLLAINSETEQDRIVDTLIPNNSGEKL